MPSSATSATDTRQYTSCLLQLMGFTKGKKRTSTGLRGPAVAMENPTHGPCAISAPTEYHSLERKKNRAKGDHKIKI
jgi:hypothetical protein